MEIRYLGHSCFRLRGRDSKVVIDPFDSKMVGLPFPKVDADIVCFTHKHADHANKDAVSNIRMVIESPGEYEVQSTSFIGIPTYHDSKKGKLRGENIIYVIEMDGLRIAHLGDLGHLLSEKQLSAVGDIDVLMVPIGGYYTIGASQAIEVVHAIEPTVTIPMHYKTDKHKKETFDKLDGLDGFLSNVGINVENEKKLTISKDSIGDLQRVVVLECI